MFVINTSNLIIAEFAFKLLSYNVYKYMTSVQITNGPATTSTPTGTRPADPRAELVHRIR